MIEMRHVRQDSDKHVRRWFFDDHFDLMAWYRKDGSLLGFQLCYDKAHGEKALTWFSNREVTHHRVDTGEGDGWFNASPMLIDTDGRSLMPQLFSSFTAIGGAVPFDLKSAVVGKIEEYGKLKPPRIQYWQAALPIMVFGAVCVGLTIIFRQPRRRRK